MAKTFAVSGQHYLFDVQAFAHTILALGGDDYEYALRDRSTAQVIEDVAAGVSELGVIVQTVSCAAAEYYNRSDSNAMVPGVQVYAVEDGGPASVAGLCSGDVIIRLDGADIATAADLTAAENGCVPGCEAVLTVYRNGEYKKIPVVFGKQPEADGEEDEAEGWCDFDNAW